MKSSAIAEAPREKNGAGASKYSYEDMREIAKRRAFLLVTRPEEFRNCATVIRYICACAKPRKAPAYKFGGGVCAACEKLKNPPKAKAKTREPKPRGAVSKERSIASTHPIVAKEFHPTKNGEFRSDRVSSKSNRVLWWKCEHGHEWECEVKERCRHNTCPECRSVAFLEPALAQEWHLTKNGSAAVNRIAAGTTNLAWWRCSRCRHEWEASPQDRRKGINGCKECKRKAGYEETVTQARSIGYWVVSKQADFKDLSTPLHVLCEGCGNLRKIRATQLKRQEPCQLCAKKANLI